MDCTGPDKGEEEYACEGRFCEDLSTLPVRYDQATKKWLCGNCWASLPLPRPPKRS